MADPPGFFFSMIAQHLADFLSGWLSINSFFLLVLRIRFIQFLYV